MGIIIIALFLGIILSGILAPFVVLHDRRIVKSVIRSTRDFRMQHIKREPSYKDREDFKDAMLILSRKLKLKSYKDQVRDILSSL